MRFQKMGGTGFQDDAPARSMVVATLARRPRFLRALSLPLPFPDNDTSALVNDHCEVRPLAIQETLGTFDGHTRGDGPRLFPDQLVIPKELDKTGQRARPPSFVPSM
jgi:hypothetical protein